MLSDTLLGILKLFFIITPNASLWAATIIWVVRLLTLLVILRNHVAPYVIGRVSGHIRVRSISLRSIRGIYFRRGIRTWSVDRIGISYRSASVDGSNRFTVKIEGLKLEIGQVRHAPQEANITRRRRMTLSDLSPSPIAFWLWSIMSRVYSCVEPHLRPAIRSVTVACIRVFIRCLPAVSQALHFDLESAEVTFAASPKSSIRIQEATFHTLLNFTQLEDAVFTEGNDTNVAARRVGSLSMAALKMRLTKSFGRTWEKAWGKTQGAASVAFTVKGISGLTPSQPGSASVAFLSLPGSLGFTSSLSFSPSRGTIDQHSLKVDLSLGTVHICVDAMLALLDTLKDCHRFVSPPSAAEPLSSPPGSPSTAAPMSPILDAIRSASKRSSLLPLKPTFKGSSRLSWLSKLETARFQLSSLRLSTQSPLGEKYETTIMEITLSTGLSNADQNSLHYQYLGRKPTVDDDLHAEVYSCEISARRVCIDRTEVNGPGHLRILSVGHLGLDIILSQWPSPWLSSSSFMTGDPNAAFLVARISIGSVEITEHLEVLQRLVAHAHPASRPVRTSPLLHSILSPVPRVALSIDFGSFCGRLICVDRALQPFAVEARTDGFIFSVNSEFVHRSFSAARNVYVPAPTNCSSLEMAIEMNLVSKPAFIRVRFDPQSGGHRFSKLDPAEADDLGEPLLSLETIDVIGRGNAIGNVGDGIASDVAIDTSSFFLDVHSSTEALSIEIWHPGVIAAVSQIMSLWGSGNTPEKTKSSIPSSRLLNRLPPGISCSFSLARLVLFVTAPDLNPAADMDITRGIALHTGIHLHYCALRAGHIQALASLADRTQKRHTLRLQKERIVEALGEAKMSIYTEQSHAFCRVALWDTSLRSATATHFVQDDPFISEKDDPVLKSNEFIQLPAATLDVNIWGRRGRIPSDAQDHCRIALHIPNLHATFQLLPVYSLLLAVNLVKTLLPSRNDAPFRPAQQSPNTLLVQIKAKIDTVQILWNLPRERFVIRIDSINADHSQGGISGLKWSSLLVWVPISHRVNKWEDDAKTRWEELIRLQKWNVSLLPTSSNKPGILLEGDSARLRIPSGYVLAHLVLDITATVKCIRHLTHMSNVGVYSDMPSPIAEAAKGVPSLNIRIGSLSFEIADDQLESKLGLIWRAGFDACRQRLDREDAFKAKVSAILAAEAQTSQARTHTVESEYRFTAQHTVSVQDAHVRLSMVHAVDWVDRLREATNKRSKQEGSFRERFDRQHTGKSTYHVPDIVPVAELDDAPPLFRAVLDGLLLSASRPSFSDSDLPNFLHEHGNGLPIDSKFSLLVPMHLHFSLTSLKASLRDYPIPLLDIKQNLKTDIQALEFDTDLVIAEEMGTTQSVEWIECPVVGLPNDVHGSMSIMVPKTIMPVKSYASPVIRVEAREVTSFAWGVSYSAATQDLTRVIETLTTATRDPSPPLAFWDKMRLVFHWKIKVLFANEVRLHMKGTRDPYNIANAGAGFAFCWQGHPSLTVGYDNPERELVQMVSESMMIVIPTFSDIQEAEKVTITNIPHTARFPHTPRSFRKICAKFNSGVRFGVGFVVERSCGTDCGSCTGSSFERKCRFFDFRPHFDVRLEQKTGEPIFNSLEDSYNRFRSDFIHLSVSLTSSLRANKPGEQRQPSNLHLSPKSFAHFWSWWALFEGVMSLPIRQGTYYSPRPISPKFGRHLATLKYRISVAQLFIAHAYIDDSRESWVDGVTPFVGVKALINKFQADMHQRDQESIVPGRVPDAIKVVRHKPFYVAEVVLNGLDLRTMVAVFEEPLKRTIDVTSSGQPSNYRARKDLPAIEESSLWFDVDDFVETDWSSAAIPSVTLLPTVACARLTYFKRIVQPSESPMLTSKFGEEHTHSCLLGQESSVSEVQIRLASERIAELSRELDHRRQGLVYDHTKETRHQREDDKKLALLDDYIAHLREVDKSSDTQASNEHAYYMPSDTVSPDEWSEFDNVYQVHNPKIFMNNAIRDILMHYYHCSRGWRGFEYHMATRAVKFIRDQAEAIVATTESHDSKPKGPTSSAQAAANALRKILTGEREPNTAIEVSEDHLTDTFDLVDPLSGWSDGVSLSKSHFCLLLKPQIVLRSETNVESVCVLAAVQAKLQAFAIMDDSNVEDPISGKIMSRSYTSLNGLQTFAPAKSSYCGDGCVPLEVLIDYRCESNDFDRLVPQTNATFHYDKFNRLRLRNNVTSVTRTDESSLRHNTHLHNETDLVRINIPRFTVSASDKHFQDISNIITGLILFSDAAYALHMERLETLIFAYDFTDLPSAANVVADLQRRLRNAMESQLDAEIRFRSIGYDGSAEILQLKAHIFLLAEELSLLFDAIKLAQNRTEDEMDQKSALLLHTSASEISWRMLDDRRDLLAKLAMRKIDYSWLSRQDSSTVNHLSIGDLQAFDGSPHAVWPEILSKHYEPANHPLLKRDIFILADWTVLAPVGGISIYQNLELSFHPMRLQVDAKVGSRIMEYVWPARRHRALAAEIGPCSDKSDRRNSDEAAQTPPSRKSLDSSRARDRYNGLTPPPLRRLGTSRSFTDLRSSSPSDSLPTSNRTRTLDPLRSRSQANLLDPSESQVKRRHETSTKQISNRKIGDAAEMKTRSSQKTFILVKISSLNLLLSIVKEESFDLRDAHIRTRELEYRNQTSSFEELVDQFIPADMSWKGWVKMAFHQPLVPVLPVARELFSKTKWIASKGVTQLDDQPLQKPLKPLLGRGDGDSAKPHSVLRRKKTQPHEPLPLTSEPLSAEPEDMVDEMGGATDAEQGPPPLKPRSRMMSMFRSASSNSRIHDASPDLPSERSDTIAPVPAKS